MFLEIANHLPSVPDIPPEGSNTPYLKVSASFLSATDECALKGYYSFVERLRGDVDQRVFLVPQLMHHLLNEKLSNKENLSRPFYISERVRDQFVVDEQSWLDQGFTITYQSPTDRSELLDRAVLAARELDLIIQRYNFANNQMSSEMRFQVPHPYYENVFLTGAIDVYDWSTQSLYDLKVSNSDAWCKEDQMYFYAWALDLLYGEKVKYSTWLLPLAKSKSKSLKFVQAGFDRVMRKVDAIVETWHKSLENPFTSAYTAWKPSVGRSCIYCPFKASCYPYKISIAKDTNELKSITGRNTL